MGTAHRSFNFNFVLLAMFCPKRDRFKQTPDGGSALSGLRVVLITIKTWPAHETTKRGRYW